MRLINFFLIIILLTALRSTAIPCFVFITHSNSLSHECVPSGAAIDGTSIQLCIRRIILYFSTTMTGGIELTALNS